jgi:hypothetical protein
MKQVLNIFVNDIRHHWYDIAISVALLAAFAWNEVRIGHGGWLESAAAGAGGLLSWRFVTAATSFLIPVSWALLAVHAVHSEPLVGDRQFCRVEDWRRGSVGTAYLLLPVSSGSASLAEP